MNNQMIEITNQEREILEYLRRGTSQKEIASKMFLSETKVERLFASMRERYECENNYQLLSFAFENHILNRMKENLRQIQPYKV